jgi:hypothetical protein
MLVQKVARAMPAVRKFDEFGRSLKSTGFSGVSQKFPGTKS